MTPISDSEQETTPVTGYYEWLESLKEGDRVIVETGCYGRDIATVIRRTKTTVEVGRDKFRISTGHQIGYASGLRSALAFPAISKVAEIETRKRIEWISGNTHLLNKIPQEVVLSIYNAMHAALQSTED